MVFLNFYGMNTFFLIKILLFLSTFFLIAFFRKQLANRIRKFKLPEFAAYLLAAILLIIFEEHINCQPSWCGQIIIPPTLPILLIEVVIVGLLTRLIKIKRIFFPVLFYSAFGVTFELLIGGLKGISATGALFGLFMIIWTGMSYALLVILPLTIIIKEGSMPHLYK